MPRPIVETVKMIRKPPIRQTRVFKTKKVFKTNFILAYYDLRGLRRRGLFWTNRALASSIWKSSSSINLSLANSLIMVDLSTRAKPVKTTHAKERPRPNKRAVNGCLWPRKNHADSGYERKASKAALPTVEPALPTKEAKLFVLWCLSSMWLDRLVRRF